MSAPLRWRTITPSTSPEFLVKGTKLSCALAGRHSRFKITEVRCYGADGFADRRFTVADAEAVSDADVRGGKSPPVVARFDGLDEAILFTETA
jgi:hypothetical protein